MASKKTTKGNHITSATETLVTRIPTTVKRALEAEAEAEGVETADVVRGALARELIRRKYSLAPETKEASGL